MKVYKIDSNIENSVFQGHIDQPSTFWRLSVINEIGILNRENVNEYNADKGSYENENFNDVVESFLNALTLKWIETSN